MERNDLMDRGSLLRIREKNQRFSAIQATWEIKNNLGIRERVQWFSKFT
jgi:hypothetical protein